MLKSKKVIIGWLIAVVLLSGCHLQQPKQTPSEMVVFYLDALLKGEDNPDYHDETKAFNLGFRSSYIKSFSKSFLESADLSGVTENEVKLADAFSDAMNKVEYEVVQEVIDGKQAIVTVEIKGIGVSANILEENTAQVFDKARGMQIEDYEDVKPLLTESIIALYANPKLLNPQRVDINLEKTSNRWKVTTSTDELMTKYIYPNF